MTVTPGATYEAEESSRSIQVDGDGDLKVQTSYSGWDSYYLTLSPTDMRSLAADLYTAADAKEAENK